MKIEVRVTPKAKENAVILDGGAIRVKTTASADRGKANEATIALLAEHYGVPKSAVSVVRGHASRLKVIEVRLR